MNEYLEAVEVPDPSALSSVRKLCDIPPYETGANVDQVFAEAMNEANTWHAERSEFFGALWSRDSVVHRDGRDLGRQPFVHAHFFKMHEIRSVPESEVTVRLTSSGTSGQRSQMFFDRWTMRTGQRMLARIFDHHGWIDDTSPVDYLLFNYQPTPGFSVGTAFTNNYMCSFAPARSIHYGLPHTGSGHEFDPFGTVRALLRSAEDAVPVRILGFPAFLMFTLDRMRDLGIPPMRLDERSLIVFGGGWKGHTDQQLPKPEFYARITEQLGIPAHRIRDGFGSVEHSVPYLECSHHHLHVPSWSRVLVRSVRTLEPLPYGEIGYLQFVSPFITSVPAHSVLMSDLAALYPPEESGCEVPTPWFRVHGRAGLSKNRSCAVAAAELLTRKGTR